MNRCVAFPAAAASDRSSIHGTLRDANGRLWPAGPAPALPSTEATTVASTARADGHTGGSVDPNERGRPAGGAAQDSRRGGLDAWTGPTGAPRPSGRRHASPLAWSAAGRSSTIFLPARDFGEGQRPATARPPGDDLQCAQATIGASDFVSTLLRSENGERRTLHRSPDVYRAPRTCAASLTSRTATQQSAPYRPSAQIASMAVF